MIGARAVRHARTLTVEEAGILASACARQLLMRLLVNVLPLRRVVSVTARPRREVAPPVPLDRLVELVGWSTRLCRGTCLTEGLVLRALAARRGLDVPLTIGVRREGDRLRAHAWIGTRDASGFAPLWRTDARPHRKGEP